MAYIFGRQNSAGKIQKSLEIDTNPFTKGPRVALGNAIEAIKQMGKRIYDTDDADIGNQNAWHYSYQCIALCEYYLLTKDESVLPAIRGINQTLVKIQSSIEIRNLIPIEDAVSTSN